MQARTRCLQIHSEVCMSKGVARNQAFKQAANRSRQQANEASKQTDEESTRTRVCSNSMSSGSSDERSKERFDHGTDDVKQGSRADSHLLQKIWETETSSHGLQALMWKEAVLQHRWLNKS